MGYPRTWAEIVSAAGGGCATGPAAAAPAAGIQLLRILPTPPPTIGDYYEPWTYDYETRHRRRRVTPSDRGCGSLISGNPMKVSWGSNWDDNWPGRQRSCRTIRC